MSNSDSVIGWFLAAFAVFFAVYQPPEEKPPASPPAAVAHEATNGQDAPAVAAPEWLTWSEAKALSSETGRPVLVLQRFRDPKDDAACLPCQRLKKTLEDPATFKAFAELGIPCVGIAEDWQTDNVTAPMIAFVAPGAAPSDKVQSLSGFRVAPASDFLTDIKAWLDAQQN